MSEENDGQQAEQQSEFKPITSQDELNKLIGERIGKVKSQYADYSELKEKAAKFDEVEAANKSELEKATERAEAAERRASEFERSAIQARVAAEEGVIPEVLTGTTEEEMRASAKRVKEWAESGRRTPPKPQSLKSGSKGAGDTSHDGKERAAAALRTMRGHD